MDKANVFLSSIIRTTNERLTNGVLAARDNATRLRWVSILGAITIVLVVGGVTVTFGRYARDIAQAATTSAPSMSASRRGSTRAPPLSARRATAPKRCWPRSIIASPTA